MLTLNQVHQGHCLDLFGQLPNNCIHSIITSPPYWGLRDYGIPPVCWPEVSFVPVAGLPPVTVPEQTCCLGLEPDIWAYVAHMVLIFREAKRVLREDGTLWLNLGDSYNGGGTHHGDKNIGLSKSSVRQQGEWTSKVKNLKPKDLASIPWRVALALQADGWYLRSDIIWAKKNCMPESVTDRPTKAHEYVFLLSKSERYFYDADAIREPHVRLWDEKNGGALGENGGSGWYDKSGQVVSGGRRNGKGQSVLPNPNGRNKRTVWTVATQSYSSAHFATFPEKLIEPMVLASTSDYGVCGKCGKPWGRVVESKRLENDKPSDNLKLQSPGVFARGGNQATYGRIGNFEKTTTGWQPSCVCNAPTVPAVILDPFMGSGTTGKVAIANRRNFIGFEMNPTYAGDLATDRIDGTQIKF